MTDGIKRLGWEVDLDLDDFKREIGTAATEIKGVGNAVGELAKQTDAGTKLIASEVKGLATDIKTSFQTAMGDVAKVTQQGMQASASAVLSVEAAVKELSASLRAAREESRSVGAQIGQILSTTKQQLEEVHKTVRQYNMTPWQKQADDYATSIRKAQAEINALTKALKASNAEEAEQEALTKKLETAQRNLNKLREQSKAHVALGIDAETVKVLDQIQQKVQAVSTATRQHGMTEWQRLADQYNVSIGQSRAQLEGMKAQLNQANISQRDRVAIQQKIAEGERAIDQLVQQSTKHVQQARDAEHERQQALEQSKAEMQSIGQVAQDIATSLGVFFGGIAAGLGTTLKGAVGEFGNFEEQLVTFSALTESTEAELAAVEKKTLDLGGSTKFTAAELAAASVELAKMGFSAEETADALDGMVSAAIASGTGLEETSSIVASTLRMFNMSASESMKVADIIARGANISAQSFESFANSIRYVGSAAAAADQDLVEISGLLAILADRGIKGTVAGNGLQNAIIRLQAPTKAAREAIAELNLAIADTHGTASKADDTMRPMLDIIKDIKKTFAERGIGKTEQTPFLKDLFGEVSLTSMQVFFNTADEKIDELMAKQRQYSGTSKRVGDEMATSFNASIERMKSSINSLQISFGKELAPTIQAIAKGIEAATNAFDRLPAPIKSIIAHVALLLAAISTAFVGSAGITMIVGKGMEGFKGLDKLLGGKLGPAFKGLGSVATGQLGSIGRALSTLVSGPIGWFIAAAVAIYAAYKTNFGHLREIVDDAWEHMKEFWGPGMQELMDGSKEAWEGFKQFMKGVLQWISEGFLTVLGVADSFFGALLRIVSATGRLIPGMIEAFEKKDWGLLKSTIEELKNAGEDLAAAMSPSNIIANAERYRESAFKRFFKDAPETEAAKKDKPKAKKDGGGAGGGDGGDNGRTQLDIIMDRLDKELSVLEVSKSQLETEKLITEQKQLQVKATGQRFTSEEALMKFVYPQMVGMGRGNLGPGTRGAHSHGYEARDVGVATGGTVQAAAAGRVITSGWVGGYGKTVMLDHGNGLVTLYAHNSVLAKKVGDVVAAGEKIALSGSTGHSSGPHGHFEIRQNGHQVKISQAMGRLPGGGASGIDLNAHSEEESLIQKKANAIHKALLAVQAYYNAQKAGSDEAQKADKALQNLKKQEADAYKELAQAGLDSAKARQQAEQEYQEEVQRGIEKILANYEHYFEEVESKLSSMTEKAGERIAELQDKLAKAGMSQEEVEQYDENKAMEAMEADIATGEAELITLSTMLADMHSREKNASQEQIERIAELTRHFEEQTAAVAKLKEQYDTLYGRDPRQTFNAVLSGLVQAGLDGTGGGSSLAQAGPKGVSGYGLNYAAGVGAQFGSEMDEGKLGLVSTDQAMSDFEKLQAKQTELANAARDWIKALGESDTAVKQLMQSAEGASIDFAQLGLDMGLSAERVREFGLASVTTFSEFIAAMDKLGVGADKLKALNDVLFQLTLATRMKQEADEMARLEEVAIGINDAVTEVVDEAFEEAAAAAEDFNNKLNTGLNMLGTLGGMIGRFGTETADKIGTVVEGLAGMAGGLKRLAAGDITGGFQILQTALDTTLRLVIQNKQEVIRYRRELEQLGVVQAQSETQKIQFELDTAIALGETPDVIKEIKDRLAGANFKEGLKSLMADLRADLGDVGIDFDEAGIPDLQERVEAYTKYVDKWKAMGDKANRGQAELDASILKRFTIYRDRLLALQHDLNQGTQANNDEFDAIGKEQKEKLAKYMQETYGDPEAMKRLSQHFIDQLGPNFVNNDATQAIADQFAQQAKGIWDEIESKLGPIDLVHLNQAGIEYLSRVTALYPQFTKAVKTELGKMGTEADKQIEKDLSDLDAEFKRRIEALKKAAGERYEIEAKQIQRLIDADQRRLDKINHQNEKIQAQIDLKEKLLKQDEDKFEKQDKSKFKAEVAGVDFDAELRKGLDAIHNPEGVETGTYSADSHKEAMKEHIELLKLKNQAALDNETYNDKDPAKNLQAFNTERMRIAAIEARFAEEQQAKAEAGSREWIELEALKGEAYQEYRDAYLEKLRSSTDEEVEVLKTSIDANNARADVIKKRMDGHRDDLDKLKKTYEKGLKEIDEGLNAVMETQDQWKVSVDNLRDGLKKPLQEMTSWYRGLKKEILAIKNAGGSLPSGGGYQTFVDSVPMATGGVVPPGFPNDSYYARLSSGEWVVPGPEPIEDALRDTFMRWQSAAAPANISNSRSLSVGQIILQGQFGQPGAVTRELGQTFQNLENSRGNAPYIAPNGL